MQPIEIADRGGMLPASLAQQRLWFLSQLGAADKAYHIHGGIRLKGPLQRAALIDALNLIVQRHEVLRTTFQHSDGQAAQVIHSAARMTLQEHDLSAHEHASELQRLARLEAGEPFDLAQGPLIRGRLIRICADEHVLLVTMHHIISDAWSMGVLIAELSALYGALSRQQDNPLPPLRIQYADYALWQRHRLQGEWLRKQLQYWQVTLKDAPSLIELPTDRPRPRVQSYVGASIDVELDGDLSSDLQLLSRRHGLTLFMTLLAGWGVLLSRLTAQRTVLIGIPVANRTRKELEGMIGFFVNTLVLRIDVFEEQSVADLLEQIRNRVLQAHSHADVPFEQVVEIIKPARNLAHSPLFQTMFVWQNTPGARLDMPGLAIEPLSASINTTQFDLTLSLRAAGDRIAGALSYATALYNRDTIERHVQYWRELLKGMVADVTASPVRITILPASERRQILRDFNATQASYPQDRCIHELFEAQAGATPEAIALVDDREQVSYRVLNERANRLAHYLRSCGVGSDGRVAICVERGVELVVCVLATLKAGGGYVPLDAEYPAQRLSYMLADSAPRVLLRSAQMSMPAEMTLPCASIAIDEVQRWSQCPATNLPAASIGLTASHLAYVIYTSGSTGEPKGAMNEHRAIVNRLLWMQQAYALGAEEAVLQKTPVSFDVSVWELFWPLLVGAKLVLAKPGGHRDPAYLRALIEQQQVSTVHFVPSMLTAFVEHGGVERCSSLKRVVCSGEALAASLAQRFAGMFPQVALYNLYGPTEAAVDVTAYACQEAAELNVVPIGRPIANTQLYVLDEGGDVVPIGVSGEIYIGGIAVARGYWQRAQLTAERFVPDAYSEKGGARLYRTGDLGRWSADGNLEYLGRNDEQVKIRGYRIECDEIAQQLSAHTQIQAAVVIAREDRAGEKSLVAYFTLKGQSEPGIEELRAHLSERLPEHMVPAAYVRLETIPLSANGKLDKRALPAPSLSAYRYREYEAPQGEIEETLAGIWQELLGVERIGRHDNFFELGGHSLLATRLIDGARRHGIQVALTAVFEHPTLASLAASSRVSDRDLPACVISIREGKGENLFFVHDVSGDAVSYFTLTGLLPARYSTYGLQAHTLDSAQQISISAMAAHYAKAMQRVQPRGPYRLAGWSIGGLIAHEMACQLEASGDAVAFVGLIDSYLLMDSHWRHYEPDDLTLLRMPGSREPAARREKSAPGLTQSDRDIAQMRRRLLSAGRSHRPSRARAQVHFFFASASAGRVHGRDSMEPFGTSLSLRGIDGDHWTIMQPPAVTALAVELAAELAAAESQWAQRQLSGSNT